MVVPISGRYSCTAPGCPLVLQSAKEAAKRKKVHLPDDAWDEPTIKQYCPNGAGFSTSDKR